MEKKRSWVLILGWLVISILFFLHCRHLWFLHDDAFISMRYAENWATGLGIVWNPGERVEGYTNFLWVFLLMLMFKLGLDPVRLANPMGFAFSCLTIWLTVSLYQKLFNPGKKFSALSPAALLISAGPFAVWTMGGLESSLFLALITAAIYCAISAEAKPSRILYFVSGACFGLSALTRPEGILFAGLTYLYLALNWLRGKKQNPGFLLISAATFMMIWAPYFLWRYSYYHSLLPNSYYVRMGTGWKEHLYLCRSGLVYLGLFLKIYGPFFCLGMPLFLIRRPNRTPWLIFLSGLILIWLVYIVYVGGDPKIYFRFFVPILPGMAVFAARNLEGAMDYLAREMRQDTQSPLVTAAKTLLVAAVCGLTLAGSFAGPTYRKFADLGRAHYLNRVAAGKWLKQNAQPGETLACFACGIIPYYSKMFSYDILGVNDAFISRQPFTKQGRTAHSKINLKYIMDKRPIYIFVSKGESKFDFSKYGYVKECQKTQEQNQNVKFCYFKISPRQEL